jgi:hypothetical protein
LIVAVTENQQANRNDFIRVTLLLVVLTFSDGLLLVFPDTLFFPQCFCGFLPLVGFWFLGYELRQRRMGLSRLLLPLSIVILMCLVCCILDDFVQLHSAEPRIEIVNQLHQIARALHAYHDKHGTFPPATVHGPDGTRLYSWRVLILPYLEEEALYTQFHLEEPWDSPHNRTLLTRIPPPYRPPRFTVASDSTLTFYQVFVGPGAAFEGNKGLSSPADFPDGSANTILVVESRTGVPWTQPTDLSYAADQPLSPLGIPRRYRLGRIQYGMYLSSSFTAALVDGSAHTFWGEVAPSTLRGWITRNGGEKLADE